MKKNILVVDDQPGIRMLLDELLTGEGFEVIVAETGKEALDEIYKKNYDLVILDYRLPLIDGNGILSQLEKDNFTVPVILMSGLTEDIAKESKNYNQLIKIVAKPFDIEELTDLITLLLK